MNSGPELRVSPEEMGYWAADPLPAQLGVTGPRRSLLICCSHPFPGPLTELGPIQKFSCWMYLTLSYTPLFLST